MKSYMRQKNRLQQKPDFCDAFYTKLQQCFNFIYKHMSFY
jgi:hypothetical protein